MKKTPRAKPKTGAGKLARRQYDSRLRQQQAARTRERIVTAGSEIAHGLSSWDWREMTFKAVGERAGVSERTVHRHFSSERQLRDAILQRLVQESGVTLDGLELGDFAGVAATAYRYLASFATQPISADEPSFAALDQHRRRALLGAVSRAAGGWSESEQEIAAAMLDMLWNPLAHERLTSAWKLDSESAVSAIQWIVGLVETAVRTGHRPARHGNKPGKAS